MVLRGRAFTINLLTTLSSMNSQSVASCCLVLLLLSFYHSVTLACAMLPLYYWYIRVKDQEIERLRIVNVSTVVIEFF